jgi:hypothetical protein
MVIGMGLAIVSNVGKAFPLGKHGANLTGLGPPEFAQLPKCKACWYKEAPWFFKQFR